MENVRDRDLYLAMGESGFYHLCTQGLSGAKLFYNSDEFAFGMRLIGFITAQHNLDVYAFVLMDNHVHIITKGTGRDCLFAFRLLKRKLSARLIDDEYPPLPENYWFKLIPIIGEDQLRKEIAYVLRNPLEKGLASIEGYLWSSAGCYFGGLEEILPYEIAGDISFRRIRSLFRSEIGVPSHWKLNRELGLLPSSFVNAKAVRKLFGNVKGYLSALIKDYEAHFSISRALDEIVEFSENEVKDIVNQTLHRLFEGKRLRDLSDVEKGKMAVFLHLHFGLKPYQISRAIFMKEKIISQLILSKEVSRAFAAGL